MSVSKILAMRILAIPAGKIICASDFDDVGTRGNVDIILHRLSKQGLIRRLGYGLYDIPRKSDVLGLLSPDVSAIIDAYARKMGHVFVPHPLQAANSMGLTTQVPTRLTYLTDGKSHVINICGLNIYFIHASPKKLVGAHSSIGIVIQAIRYFGAKLPGAAVQSIARQLSKGDLTLLKNIKAKVMRNVVPQIDRIISVATIH